MTQAVVTVAKVTITAVVIRKDGKRQDLGVIVEKIAPWSRS
jgi:hypothetical protein